MSGIEIPDMLDDEEGEATDYFTLLKWLYQKDIRNIQKRFGPDDIITIIGTFSESNLKKGNDSETENDLTAAFQKCIAGIRERRNIPNAWQEHLLNVLKLIGYPQGEIFDAISDYFAAADPDIKRTFNSYARQFWGREVFIDLST